MKNLHKNRFKIEWFLCTGIIGILYIFFNFIESFLSIDKYIYDQILKFNNVSQNTDIVIITIDDKSLEQLGTWPWSRDIHTRFLNHVAISKPKTVGIDIFFIDKDPNPEIDDQLSKAFKAKDLGQVYLPVTLRIDTIKSDNIFWNLPNPSLSFSTKNLGHVNVELDTDGVARSIYLHPNPANGGWPSMPLLLYKEYKKEHLLEINKNEKNYIPYTKFPENFQTLSYVDVLNKKVHPSILENKIVLIGVTATGLGDNFLTPISKNKNLTPSIFILATTIQGLIDNRIISKINEKKATTYSFAIIIFWMILLFKFNGRKSFFSLLFLVLNITLISSMFLLYASLWWQVANLLICCSLGYVLWSWRRVSLLLNNLKLKTTSLMFEFNQHTASLNADQTIDEKSWESTLHIIDTRILNIDSKIKQLFDIFSVIPEAFFITDGNGNIMMANNLAGILFQDLNLKNKNLSKLMLEHCQPLRKQYEDYQELMHSIKSDTNTTHEIQFFNKKTTIIKSVMLADLRMNEGIQFNTNLWVILFIDVSNLKKLQKLRDEASQLLWHDLRSPLSAILTLLDNVNIQSDSNGLLHTNIRKQICSALSLADDFIWQIRADSGKYNFIDVNFINLITEVIDNIWILANSKNISIQTKLYCSGINLSFSDPSVIETGLWMQLEPHLLSRAFFNLLDNSIKYSNTNTVITITINIDTFNQQTLTKHFSPEWLILSFEDQGFGIESENLEKIFDPYSRFTPTTAFGNTSDVAFASGHGLGLQFVKTVIELHGGHIDCESTIDVGTKFIIQLPLKHEGGK